MSRRFSANYPVSEEFSRRADTVSSLTTPKGFESESGANEVSGAGEFKSLFEEFQ
ncbi:hypothetical protein Hbor_27380 [Halogeometricum borinquense DSM 11551]|uniref:Uncharacterized protein n=1 Tax=Halogeometricum borinquense (strain ATCC 700274 / DSM 11551 / JCM 10706 / KCTC 4070 / PR3) TaxID=469382 RepID=E4NTX7_HALBP|nr:hypothetical protein Hbor_27380 [Halogeometricum borinquense DSM 11551]